MNRPSCSHCGHRSRHGVIGRDNLVLCSPVFGLDCFRLVREFGHSTPCTAPVCMASVAARTKRENNQVIEDR